MGELRDPPMLKIGQMACRFGLNTRTLRYYEELGLLPAPTRAESGYRLYSEADARRLQFVLQARQIGFRLEEIRHILQLGEPGARCGFVRETLRQHVAAIETQLSNLQRRRAELAVMVAAWEQLECTPVGHVCGLIEQWSPSLPRDCTRGTVMTQKRNVEVFTAGCPVCEPAVELVRRVACSNCDVTIHNVMDDASAAARARAANVTRLPTVLVDGRPLECCQIGPIMEAALRAAGVGSD